MIVKLFAVGGCIRDELLGVRTKDWDFAVETDSFSTMREFLVGQGFDIFVETPEFLTIRARFPKGHAITALHGNEHITADFVLCRKDGRSSNSRHPDEVTPGTILDDLARRDFTVNALARSESGSLIDPHGGQRDLERMILRFVGDPDERIREDSLRVLRGVRFAITKGFTIERLSFAAMQSTWVACLLASVSTERVREELQRAFHADTMRTIRMLDELHLLEVLFERHGLWLQPTMRSKP